MLKGIVLGSVLAFGSAVYGQEAKKAELPKEVKVAEARHDKVKILTLEIENIDLKKRAAYEALIAKLQEQPEWKKLEAEQTEANRKLGAELQATLRNAGVPEAEWNRYEYRQAEQKFVLKPDAPAPAEPSKP